MSIGDKGKSYYGGSGGLLKTIEYRLLKLHTLAYSITPVTSQ